MDERALGAAGFVGEIPDNYQANDYCVPVPLHLHGCRSKEARMSHPIAYALAGLGILVLMVLMFALGLCCAAKRGDAVRVDPEVFHP